MHTNWFLYEHQVHGLQLFINWAQELDDVFFTTVTDFLLWVTADELVPAHRYRPDYSHEAQRVMTCEKPNSCAMPHTNKEGISELRYMRTCQECPDAYPWLLQLNEE